MEAARLRRIVSFRANRLYSGAEPRRMGPSARGYLPARLPAASLLRVAMSRDGVSDGQSGRQGVTMQNLYQAVCAPLGERVVSSGTRLRLFALGEVAAEPRGGGSGIVFSVTHGAGVSRRRLVGLRRPRS
jgi:hypothetical protein